MVIGSCFQKHINSPKMHPYIFGEMIQCFSFLITWLASGDEPYHSILQARVSCIL
jgi:hypothetical protein